MGIWQSLLLGGQIKMKNEESKEQYDISDYHRLECLGDDIKEIDRYLRKLAHIVVFAVFAVLFCITVRIANLPVWTMSLVYIFTVIDEATKPLIKGRHFSISDVMLNVAGTTLGVLAAMLI